MTASSSFVKDTQGVLDFSFDYKAETHGTAGAKGNWLGEAESITSHTITADTGITVDSHAESDGVVTVWLSGGTAGKKYKITCKVVTDGGRTDRRTITVEIKDR